MFGSQCSKRLVAAALGGIFCSLAAVAPVDAALTITAGDITFDGSNYTYTYQLTRADMWHGATDEFHDDTKFDQDVFSRLNVTAVDETAHSSVNTGRFVRGNPNTSYAEFVLRFDFAGTGFWAVEADFFERSHVFSNGEVENTRITTGYSADGGGYTNLSVLQPATPGSEVVSTSGTRNALFGSAATVVDYRVMFETLAGDTSNGMSGDRNQWGRTGTNDTVTFSATFTLVPIPEPAAALVLAPLALAAFRRR